MGAGGKLYEATRETADAVGFYDNRRTLIPAIRAARLHVIIVPHHRWRAGDDVGWKHMNPTQVRANQSRRWVMFSSMYPRWLSYGCNTEAPDPLSLRHQLIERRAYGKWLANGCPRDTALQDWLKAEVEIDKELEIEAWS
jgi:hypothetical protein